MFYISANLGNNMINVTDTSDNVTETISVEQAMVYKENGVVIRGISKLGTVFCKSNDLIKDYVTAVRPTLAKLKMMNSLSYDNTVKTLTKLAVDIGLCENINDFIINYEDSTILIKSRSICIVYDNLGNYTLRDISRGIDISNTKVTSEITKVGAESLEYLKVILNGHEHKLSDVMSVAVNVLSKGKVSNYLDFDGLSYIGYTPSNYIFKVIVDDVVYSLEFTNDYKEYKFVESTLLTRASKINKAAYSIIRRYIYYAEDISVDGIYIKKCNLKRGLDFKSLHEKYKTLKDIYVK